MLAGLGALRSQIKVVSKLRTDCDQTKGATAAQTMLTIHLANHEGKPESAEESRIDHLDLDRANAQALLDCGVVAVVNAAPFISGRYPNLGPSLLAGAGETVGSALVADARTDAEFYELIGDDNGVFGAAGSSQLTACSTAFDNASRSFLSKLGVPEATAPEPTALSQCPLDALG